MRYCSSSALQRLLAALSFCAVINSAALPGNRSAEVVDRLFPIMNGTTLPNVAVDIKPLDHVNIPSTNGGDFTVLPAIAVDEHPNGLNTTTPEQFLDSVGLVLSKETGSGTSISNFTLEDFDRDRNYCRYHRSHFGFNRYWLVIAPGAKKKDIPGWCGGLWDNLQRWASCSAVSRAYCGKRKDEDEGKPGLQWEFKITDTCHSGYMNSVWWEATKGKLGEMDCVKDPKDKVT